MSYTSAPGDDEDMFEMDSKDSGNGCDHRSSMYAEDDNDKSNGSYNAATLQHSELVNRPNSLTVTRSVVSPTISPGSLSYHLVTIYLC